MDELLEERLGVADREVAQLLESLRKLLRPLGLDVAAWWGIGLGRACWRVKGLESGWASIELDRRSVIGYVALEQMCKDLYRRIWKFGLDGRSIRNPYYGCSCLEEMQVKCDLMGSLDVQREDGSSAGRF